jgi:fatty-acyl-CoA synthase
VVGIPHPVYGEQIVGVIELVDVTADGAAPPSPAESEIIKHVKERLAGYKAPRRVRVVDTIGRAPNGKVDYKRHRAESIEEIEPAT